MCGQRCELQSDPGRGQLGFACTDPQGLPRLPPCRLFSSRKKLLTGRVTVSSFDDVLHLTAPEGEYNLPLFEEKHRGDTEGHQIIHNPNVICLD